MAWRRKRAGRPRKDGPRHPSGQLRRENIKPPDEVLQRRARYGRAQAETDWIIDQWWADGALAQREREAAQRLNALVRARQARIGAPRATAMAFHDARGPSCFAHIDTSRAQELALRASLQALRGLDTSGAASRATVDAVVYNRVAPVALVRVGLQAVAAALAKPLSPSAPLTGGPKHDRTS
jgi:hypothetical protein